jgi:hypothetical protein
MKNQYVNGVSPSVRQGKKLVSRTSIDDKRKLGGIRLIPKKEYHECLSIEVQ